MAFIPASRGPQALNAAQSVAFLTTVSDLSGASVMWVAKTAPCPSETFFARLLTVAES